jgi:hypothetical protein
MLKKIKLLTLIVMLFTAMSVSAQVTTSSMTGIVTENNGPLIGATIQAVHVPSGTKYNAVSNLDGRYTIQGMRTGGPYRVEVSYVGYEKAVYNDIYLELGNTYVLDAKMAEGSKTLDEVVVVGTGKAQQAGASKNFSISKIESAPTVDRNIYDIVKNMPMTFTAKSTGGISFAGSNNRYNSFQIDGTVSNDVFGLSASGTNGGQASANPISLDAIQEIQVVVAPFDVRQSGFTGGGINAITKQGTNTFHATYYTYYTNQNMYGRYDASRDNIKNKLSKQHTTTVGGNIGGAIVKDKLFYFANIENTSESYPSSYYAGSASNYLSTSTAQQILDHYNQLTGNKYSESFGQRDVKRHSFDFLARLDWNINVNNKLAIRYQHMNAYDEKYTSGYATYYFNNSTYKFNNVTNSFVAELNSTISKNFYNELRASYTRVRDSRDVPYEGPLMYIRNVPVGDDSRKLSGVDLGTEYSSGANSLGQDIYTFEDNLSWYKGKHTFTAGTHNEIFKMKNLFIQANNGEWVYNSLDDFLKDNPNQFVFKCTNPTYTDGRLDWTPQVKSGQFGLYLQDKFEISRNLQLTYGARIDIPVMFTNPTTNVEFNAYSFTKGFGVRVGEMPTAKVMWSPRFGFRWYANDTHNTLVRGGLGLFTGRVPFVWLSNAFSNTGIELTGTTINDKASIPAVTSDPNVLSNLITSGAGSAPVPDIVTVSKKFRYPQVFRANLALEQRLPYDIKMTIEAMYSKTYNNVYFRNLALTQSGSTYAVAGSEASAAPFYTVDKKYYSIVNLENTDKGYTYNLSATFEKTWAFGLNALVSYSFGHSKSIYDGTSSVAYSNWKYNYAIDTNQPKLDYSMFDQPHHITVSVGYTTPKYANGWLQTNVAVNYNGYSGQRYSLAMNESSDYNGDGYRGNSLLYIPTESELKTMNFVDITTKDASGATVVKTSADEQRQLFESFIEGDKYCKNHRGQYAPRNSNLSSWENQIDLHLSESIFALKERGSKVLLSFDVINFANMLNKKWGAYYGGTYNVTPLNVTGLTKSANGVYVAKYTWNGYSEPTKASIGSRWHAQIGIKLIF